MRMSTLDAFAEDKLAALEARRLRRTLVETGRGAGAGATQGGRSLVSFCCNDYLGLSQHPAVKQAAIAAVERYGAGAGASRLVTGNHPLHAALESALAGVKGTEAAVVFGSGYLTNIGVVPTLVGDGDLVLADGLVHACLNAGAQLARAETRAFRHNDVDHCRDLLRGMRAGHPRCLILTEGVFSMDGDRAPLAALASLALEYDAWLLVDDAHGFGVLGGGRGSAFEAGAAARIPLHMGTLSKAAGAYGGYLCASRPVVDLIKTRARSFIYTTGLPPAVVASGLKSVELIADDPALCAQPLAKARRFTARLGLPEAASAIVPLVIGDPARALAASEALAERGFLVTAIRPPTVPENTSRLRFTFSAAHTDAAVDALAAAVRDIGLAG